MPIFKANAECESCNGTGIFQGMAEREDIGVVCHTCDGTGEQKIEFKYKEFKKRKKRKKIKRVIAVNPGMILGTKKKNEKELEKAYGGLTYKDWFNDAKFTPGTEMRNYTCPGQWYQAADYSKRPQWDDCGFSFNKCPYFHKKEKCWERWDGENKGKKKSKL